MTQEEKDLLLKDLSARLPYGVLVLNKDGDVESFTWQELKEFGDGYISKPYLRPRSSIASLISAKEWSSLGGIELIDWYNANHIDYRGLIEKGLAIAVTEENNPYKE